MNVRGGGREWEGSSWDSSKDRREAPRLPASAPAFWSQVMVISCKGANTLGSESLKPVIEASAHTHTHALALRACVRGWRLSREAELFGRRPQTPEQGEGEREGTR